MMDSITYRQRTRVAATYFRLDGILSVAKMAAVRAIPMSCQKGGGRI